MAAFQKVQKFGVREFITAFSWPRSGFSVALSCDVVKRVLLLLRATFPPGRVTGPPQTTRRGLPAASPKQIIKSQDTVFNRKYP